MSEAANGAELSAFPRDHLADMQNPEYAAAFEQESRDIAEYDRRERYFVATGHSYTRADAAMAVADEEITAVQDGWCAATRAIRTENARLREELAAEKEKYLRFRENRMREGAKLEHENARSRAELERRTLMLQASTDEIALLRAELFHETSLSRSRFESIERVRAVLTNEDITALEIFQAVRAALEDENPALDGIQESLDRRN